MLQSRIVKGRTTGNVTAMTVSFFLSQNVLGEGCTRSAWRQRAYAGQITGRIAGLRAVAGLYSRVNDRSAPLSAARRVAAAAAVAAATRDISPSPRETLLCSACVRSASYTPATLLFVRKVLERGTYLARI